MDDSRLPSDVLSYTKGAKGFRYHVTISSKITLSHALVLRANNKMEADEIANNWIRDNIKRFMNGNKIDRMSVKLNLAHERLLTAKEQRIFDHTLEIAKRDQEGKFLTPTSPEWSELATIKNENN